jgi:hypothetical protein
MNRMDAISWAKSYAEVAQWLLNKAMLSGNTSLADPFVNAALLLTVEAASLMAPLTQKDSEE